MTAIRTATAADAGALAAVLGPAFADDPGWRWVYPQPDRARRLTTMFRALVAASVGRGATVLSDGERRAAAIWQRSDARNLGVAGSLRMGLAMVASRARIRRGQAILRTIERHHPAAPHWYLATLGTDPAHQGRGLGSALVHHVLDDPANAGEAAYLETSTERNVAFYARLGFEVIGEVDVPGGGPHMWLMWREPPAAA